MSIVRTTSATASEDGAGRDRLIRNVLSSWGGHIVFIVAGFLMPRMMDHYVGQRLLGVWDFGWSIVSYFELAQIGVGSSVNRFVAKYRAVGDVEGLRHTVSTVSVIQAFAGLLIASLTAALLWILPVMFGERLGAELETARWIVGLLGAGLAVQMLFNGYHGVITGCHRWDLHNALSSGFHAVTVAGMLGVLMAGFGLRTVAAVYVAGMIALGFARALVAHRVCPELQVRIGYSSWAHAKTLMTFGGKTLADALSRLLLFQSNNLIVASVLGPAALAVYARPNALMRHAETLVNKFAFVLTPAASSLESAGKQEQLRELVIQSTRYATYLTLPMVVTFVLMGDLILRVWMGPLYEPGPVLVLLALGYFTSLTQRPAMQVLMGMNLHGWVGITSLMMSVAGVALGVFFVGWLGWGLTGAALAVGIPLTAGKGLFTAWYACHQLDIPVAVYLRRGFLGPLATAVPFAAALIVGRTVFSATPAQALVGGLALGAVVIAPLYWHFGIPANLRRKIARRFPGPLGHLLGAEA